MDDPKFKVGDHVRVIHSDKKSGQIGKITYVGNYGGYPRHTYQVKLDENGQFFYGGEYNIELVNGFDRVLDEV